MTHVEPQLDAPAPSAGHVQNRLPGYVDRTLAEREMDRVEAHLLSCETCFTALVVLSLGQD